MADIVRCYDDDGNEYLYNKENKKLIFIEDIVSYRTKAQDEAYKAIKGDLEAKEAFLSSNTNAFIWLIYAPINKLFPNLTNAEIARLVYLATYLDFDSDFLMKNVTKKTKLTVEDLPKTLNICKRSVDYLISKLSSLDIIKIENNNIKINKEIFSKGSIDYKHLKTESNKEVIRLYKYIIRKLYNNCSPKQHKKLAYIFKLVPWINKRYNVVCSNIYEEEIDEVQVLSLSEICDILDYEQCNIYKLFKNLNSVTINDEKIFCYMTTDELKNATIYINPRVYYAGSNSEVIDWLRKVFRNDGAKRQNKEDR